MKYEKLAERILNRITDIRNSDTTSGTYSTHEQEVSSISRMISRQITKDSK